MADSYIGEIRLLSFNYAPRGWALCNGQLLPINQNQALFSLLGTQYGGDGRVNFALPNLVGRVAIGAGQGAGLQNYVIGQAGGSATAALNVANLPPHTHTLNATTVVGSSNNPSGKLLAVPAVSPRLATLYGTPGGSEASLAADVLSSSGGGQPHTNMQPSTVLNYCIALVGIYPSRN